MLGALSAPTKNIADCLVSMTRTRIFVLVLSALSVPFHKSTELYLGSFSEHAMHFFNLLYTGTTVLYTSTHSTGTVALYS